MPTLSAEELRRLDTLRKEYRIEFVGELQPEEWPECHKVLLGHLVELGDKKFRSYATDGTVADESPWKLDAKQHARNLVELAKRNKHRNESSWRYSCEPYILARLSGEVVCRNCRKRVWRSELEARHEMGTRRGLALQGRQRAREPCRCHRMARGQDHLEAVGLNAIFGKRYEEAVQNDPVVSKRLKRVQKPDAVFGLRQTRNIENLLHDTRKHQLGHNDPQQLLQEELQPSPMNQPLNQNGDELLYPFLVLEAKGGMADCDWHSIQVQTAFPIRAFLETQRRLFTASESQECQSAPLVWFLANRGEDWRVSVAYMTESGERPHTIGCIDYVVVDVWRGSICTLDGALQLLLIVDYIFDWARDVYREETIRALRILASGDNDAASTTYTDSNIFSTQHIDQVEMHSSTAEAENYDAYISAQMPFVARDTEQLHIRHATFIESKYCCLFATRDNVRTMLLSTKTNQTQRICRILLERMSKAMLLDQSFLEAIEERWTSTVRGTPAELGDRTQFYTTISCTNYLSGEWHQIRELDIVAIADDAWDIIVEYSQLKAHRRYTKRPPLSDIADRDALLKAIDRLQTGTTGDTIIACITRRAVELRLLAGLNTRKTTSTSIHDSASLASPMSSSIHAVVSDGGLRDIVQYIYMYIKKGSLEPQDSFLRISNRFDQQHQLLQGDQPLYPHKNRIERLELSKDGCLLLQEERLTQDFGIPRVRFCLYIVNGEPILPTEQEVIERVKCSFETRDVYHTTRQNGTPSPTNIRLKAPQTTPWNLQRTYGISGALYIGYWEGFFEGCAQPRRQGSRRIVDDTESGGYLWKRTMFPWNDASRRNHAGLKRTYLELQMFLSYKLVSQEIHYWKGVSRARNSKGTLACAWCAAVEHKADFNGDICVECSEASKMSIRGHGGDNYRPRWFHNRLKGDPPFIIDVEHEAKAEDKLWEHDLHPSDSLWERVLSTYPALEEPFDDLRELDSQCTAFRRRHQKNRDSKRPKKRQKV